MTELTHPEMTGLDGGGFCSGVACGLGIVSAFYLALQPNPLSKIALIAYGGGLFSCVTASRSRVLRGMR